MGVNPSRVHAGVPTGGQFAVGAKAESADLPVETYLSETWEGEFVRTVTWEGGIATNSETGEKCEKTGDSFHYTDSDGQPHRDPSRGPAICNSEQIAYALHGVAHRDPAQGPAIIKPNGQVFYVVNGVTTEPPVRVRGNLVKSRKLGFVNPSLTPGYDGVRRYQFDLVNSRKDPWS